MKKIVLIDASQRERGNSEIIVDKISQMLPDADVHVFRMKKQNCQYCVCQLETA